MQHATFVVTDDHRDQPRASRLTRYEDDAHAWALEQAELLKARRFADLDIDNLADEVQDVARRERNELVSRLGLVFQHLLKWDVQPERRSASWARTIREQRLQVDELLGEARSLRAHLPALSDRAFRHGRVAALNETGLSDSAIPDANPYSWDEVMTRPVTWPEP